MSINLAGPAYRVTVPACVLVATLRKKLKAEQEAEQAEQEAEQAEQEAEQAEQEAEQAEQEAKQKAEQEADKTEKMWYLAIISIVLIGLAVLAVFYMKGKHHSSDNPSNNPKSGVEKLKNPSYKN